MPPKAKYTREEIADTAFQMVRRHGMDFLSARSLAAELGTSTAPIFTAFGNIENLASVVTERAGALYNDYIKEGMKDSLPFKGVGMKYVQFAKDEPELFKLLLSDLNHGGEPSHFLPSADENTPSVLNVIKKAYGIDEVGAARLYNHMSVYTHGLASLFASGSYVFTLDDVSEMLTEIFRAVIAEIKKHGGNAG